MEQIIGEKQYVTQTTCTIYLFACCSFETKMRGERTNIHHNLLQLAICAN